MGESNANYAAAVADDPDYSLLDRGGVSAQIFFPRPDPSPTPAGATDHVVEVGDGVSIAARRYEIDAHGPTIVYFHGNGEVLGDHDGIAPLYHSIGTNLFVFEFRGYGRSTGSPTIEHLVADGAVCGERALELLDADGFDGPRLVMGRSLGANPALEVAARVSGYCASDTRERRRERGAVRSTAWDYIPARSSIGSSPPTRRSWRRSRCPA